MIGNARVLSICSGNGKEQFDTIYFMRMLIVFREFNGVNSSKLYAFECARLLCFEYILVELRKFTLVRTMVAYIYREQFCLFI